MDKMKDSICSLGLSFLFRPERLELRLTTEAGEGPASAGEVNASDQEKVVFSLFYYQIHKQDAGTNAVTDSTGGCDPALLFALSFSRRCHEERGPSTC